MKTRLFAHHWSRGPTAAFTILAVAAGPITVPIAAGAANGRAVLAALVTASATLLLAFSRRGRPRPCVVAAVGRPALAIGGAGTTTHIRHTAAPSRDLRGHRVDNADAAVAPQRGTGKAFGPPSLVSTGRRVIGYVTVPADHSASQAAGASSDLIEVACTRSGWKLLQIVRDRENGRLLDRPGLRYALELIASDTANVLVISELERVSRSIVDLGALMAWFRDTRATLVALDLRIDTSTREGYHVATTLIALSYWERERIAHRTRTALAEVRASGQPTGRPAVTDRPELLAQISAMRAANLSLRAIADQLNAEHVPTLRGGREWRPSSIQAALGYRRPGPRDHLPQPRKA